MQNPWQRAFPKDHRELLRAEFARRCARNGRYSIRSYARDLGIAASTLTEVMSGRYGLSRAKALKVGERLRLDPEACDHFADLFESKFHRNETRRKAAVLRVAQKSRPETTMSLDTFQVIAEWYHFALLEVVALLPEATPRQLGRRLGLRANVTEDAIERLIRVGLLKRENDGLVPCDDFTVVGNETPSAALVKYHQGLLSKALVALETQPVERRNFSNTIFTMDRSRLDEAKRDLKRMRLEFAEKYGPGSSTPGNDVVCLGMQLFSVLEEEGGESE